MTFEEVEEYLYNRLPTYQNQGVSALNYKLDNIRALCAQFKNPQDSVKMIHIAGTNGKGSVSHGIASVLQESGFSVGLYTSPHIYSFTERIKISGIGIPKQWIVGFVETNQHLIETSYASFFEITVLMAFVYFKEEKVDVAVIEVGLGGRFDSTNIITPELSVITNIGLDHTEVLGDTLAKIAFEKAGIIKPEVPVVIGEQQSETEDVFKRKAKEQDTEIYWASELELLASNKPFGALNDRTIRRSIDVLRSRGWEIPIEAIGKGLAEVQKNTGIVGRWQELSTNPRVICDAAHNIDGFMSVSKWLNQVEEDLVIILGMVQDKDHHATLSLLPKGARFIFCSPTNPRGLSARDLKKIGDELGLRSVVMSDVNDALSHAKSEIQEQGTIFVGGSNFTIADIDQIHRN